MVAWTAPADELPIEEALAVGYDVIPLDGADVFQQGVDVMTMTSISYIGILFFRTLVKGGRNYSNAWVTRLATFRMKSIEVGLVIEPPELQRPKAMAFNLELDGRRDSL